MNERIRVFIKMYLSHFILERVNVCCVWEMSWRQGRTVILTQALLVTIAAFLSHLGWGCSTVGPCLEPYVCSWVSLRWHPASDWLEPPQVPGYIIVSRSPASAVFPLIYTGASLDWRLGRGSIYNTEVLGNAEYSFIAIAPRSTMARSGRTW